jgi:hypothetical protein
MAANLSQFSHCNVLRFTLASILDTRSVIDCNLLVSTKLGNVAAAVIGLWSETCWHQVHCGLIGHISPGFLVLSALRFMNPLSGDAP